jgi:hypothetical protein
MTKPRKTLAEMLAEPSTTPEKMGWRPSIFDAQHAAKMLAAVQRKIQQGKVTSRQSGTAGRVRD